MNRRVSGSSRIERAKVAMEVYTEARSESIAVVPWSHAADGTPPVSGPAAIRVSPVNEAESTDLHPLLVETSRPCRQMLPVIDKRWPAYRASQGEADQLDEREEEATYDEPRHP